LEWSTDTGISRLAGAELAIGNGTAGDYSGNLKLTTIQLTNTAGLSVNNGNRIASGNGTAGDYSGYFQATIFEVFNGTSRGQMFLGGNGRLVLGYGSVPQISFTSSLVVDMDIATVLGWDSHATGNLGYTLDTGISRLGAASLAIGNGTAGDFSGTLKCATVNATSAYQANGTPGVTQTAIAVGTLATIEGIVTTFTGVSDERLKNHAPYTGGLEEILGITPIRFTYNELGQKFGGWDKEHVYVGFSAQNVQKSIPEAIQGTEGKEKYLSFDDRPVIAALCNAIKELTARITELEMSVRYLLEHCRRSVPGNRAQ
jgi:hypothetical protein